MPLTKKQKQMKVLKKPLRDKHLLYLNDLEALFQPISDQLTANIAVNITIPSNTQSPSYDSKNWLRDKIESLQRIKKSLLGNTSKNKSQDLASTIEKLEEAVDLVSDYSQAIDKLEKMIHYFYSDPFLVKVTSILQEVVSQKELSKILGGRKPAKRNPPNDSLAKFVLFLKKCPYIKRLPFSTVAEIEFIGLDNLKSILESNLYIVEAKVIFGDPVKSAEYESLIAPYIETHVINREYVDIIEPYTTKGLPTPIGADKNLPKKEPFQQFKQRLKKATPLTQEGVNLELQSIEENLYEAFTLLHAGVKDPFEIIESFITGEIAIKQQARKKQDPHYAKKIEVSMTLLAKILQDLYL